MTVSPWCPRCAPRLSASWGVIAPRFCSACLTAFSDTLHAMNQCLPSPWIWLVYAVISRAAHPQGKSRFRWEGLGLLLPPEPTSAAPLEEWLYRIDDSGILSTHSHARPFAQLWQQRVYWSSSACYLEKRWHPDDVMERPLALIAPADTSPDDLGTLWQGRHVFSGKKRVVVRDP